MQTSYFHIVVKWLLKRSDTVRSGDQIWKLVQTILHDQYTDSKLYKIIYQLKNRWYLITIKKDLYFVKDIHESYEPDQLLQMYYRPYLYQHCKMYIKGFWYIWWIKALQIMVHNLEIPNDVLIVTDHKQSQELILFDKYLTAKTYTSRQKSLLKYLKPYTLPCTIQSKKMYRAWLELWLLESLYNCDITHQTYTVELIKNILRKYHKQIDYSVLTAIVRLGKHHTSLNRLHVLSKYIDDACSTQLASIIKKYSYFITVS